MPAKFLILILALASLTACTQREQPPLIFVGIDGAEWDIIDAMIADGELPHIAQLRKEGSWGHLINTGPLASPVAWTTFSTGHFARQHGILDFTYPYVRGIEKRPVSALDKRKPALWNVASHEGLTVSVVGYFVTHPAEKINGVMISDRATQDVPGAVSPPGAVSRRDIEWALEGKGRAEWLDRLLPWYRGARESGDPVRMAALAHVDGTNVVRLIKHEAFVHRQTLEQLDSQPDILVSYYRLPDVMSHTFWKFHDDSDFAEPTDETMKGVLGSVVREAYRAVDDCLGEILDEMHRDTNIVIVSDHGMGSATGPYAPRRVRDFPISGNHRTDGIIVARGPDIASGEIVEMNNLDVMPTLMALARLPVSEALPGEVRTDLLAEDFLARHPLRTVPQYPDDLVPASEAPAPDRAAEQETLNTLQGLGYVGGDISAGDEIRSRDVVIWSIQPRLFAQALIGEAVFHLLRRDDEALRALLDEVERNAPERFNFFKRQLAKRVRATLTDAPLTAETQSRFQQFLTRLESTE